MDQFDLKKMFRIPTPTQRLAALNLRPDVARAAVRMVTDERSDREVQQLEHCLTESESVVALIEGSCRRELGLLALTTERLLFRPHGAISGQAVIIPLSDVSAVESQVRKMTSRVTLRCIDSIVEVDKILGTQATAFAAAIRNQMIGSHPAPEPDPIRQLQELREQRVSGTISEADYQSAKSRLFDEL